MTFTLKIKVDTQNQGIKNDCLEVMADYLRKRGVRFDVGYDPNEIDMDLIGKA